MNTNAPKTGEFWRIIIVTANSRLYYIDTYALLHSHLAANVHVARSTTHLARFST